MRLRLAEVVESAIAPALRLLPPHLDTDKARLMLLAIGLQESRFEHRAQITNSGGKGPALGFWQFEEGGGVRGVWRHHLSTDLARQLCHDRDCEFSTRAIWTRLETDDVLAAGFARLLLWTDPKPLPAIGATELAWGYYLRTWRPGKPHPKTWPPLYARAVEEVTPSHPKGSNP